MNYLNILKVRGQSHLLLLLPMILLAGVVFFIFKEHGFKFYLFTLSLLLALFLMPKNFVTNSLFFILISIVFTEAVFAIAFQGRVSKAILDSIIETNPNELVSMGGALFWRLVLPVCLLVIGALWWRYKIDVATSFRKKVWVISILVLLAFFARFSYKLYQVRDVFSYQDNPFFLGHLFYQEYPILIGDTAYFWFMLKENKKYNDLSEIEEFDESIIGNDATLEVENIIIVMGESALSERFSVYGYELETTPHSAKIFSGAGGCILKDAHSVAPVTRDAVTFNLAFYTPESDQKLFERKSIVEMAKAKGYKTYWIGAQTFAGFGSSKYGIVAKKSDVMNILGWGKDDLLAGALTEVLQDSAAKRLIVLHLNGSHQPYNLYDEHDKEALPTAEEYDLTIHHTDRVLNDVHMALEHALDNYVLFYTSDHGEIIGYGHSFGIDRREYLVPLMIRSSLGGDVCEYAESLRGNHGYISALMYRYLFSRMLGYALDEALVEKERAYDRVQDASRGTIVFNELRTRFP